MSFLKRLFGGKPESATPPLSADDPSGVIAWSREGIRTAPDEATRKQHQQTLATNLITTAGQIPNLPAEVALNEAETILAQLIATIPPGSNAHYRPTLINLYGRAAFHSADHLHGDNKGQAYADAANRFADALSSLAPEENRALWLDCAIMRGAALHELGRMRADAQALAWLDEAARVFGDVAAHGAEPPERHAVGDYNRYVALEERARRTPLGEARPYFEDARRSLIAAMASPMFNGSKADMEQRLAQLDATLKA